MLKFIKKLLTLRLNFKLPSIGIILVIAFAIRLCWYLYVLFQNPDGFWLYDSNDYWNLAYNLDEHGVFSSRAEEPLYLNYYRTPLYPLFILPTVWFDDTGNSIPFIQIFIQVVNIFVLYKILLLLNTSERTARMGAVLFAFDLCSIVFCNYVLTETLFTFLLSCSIYFFIRSYLHLNYKNIFWCALFCGLTIMCRPIAFYIPWLFAAVFIFKSGIKNFYTYKTIAIFSFVVLLVQYPWMERNHQLYGKYFNSVIGEHDLLGLHASLIYAQHSGMNLQDAQDELRWRCFRQVEYDVEKHPYEYAKLVQRVAITEIKAHPGLFLKNHVQQVFYFFAKPARTYASVQSGLNAKHPLIYALVVLQFLWLLIIYSGVILLFLKWKKHRYYQLLFILALMIFIFANLNVPPYTDARMRVVIHPLLICLASLGWLEWIKHRVKAGNMRLNT